MLQANRFHLHKHFDARKPQHDSADLFVGVDVGKGHHRAVALDRTGKRLSNNALPNDETKLRALITELKAHGQLLFVVDKPVTIGAVPLADARDGPSLKRLPARCRTRCAHFDSLTSRSPNSTMLCGSDNDHAAKTNQPSNRIRGLLTQIHPALERRLAPCLDHSAARSTCMGDTRRLANLPQAARKLSPIASPTSPAHEQ
jgi:hypothetical protein